MAVARLGLDRLARHEAEVVTRVAAAVCEMVGVVIER